LEFALKKNLSFFAAIGNAVAILIDVEKRKQYDMYGPEEERMQSTNVNSRQSHTHYNYTRGFEGKKVKKKDVYLLRNCARSIKS